MPSQPRRATLLAMTASLLTFIAAAAWGSAFGFPEPDAGPDKAAQLAFRAGVAGGFMLIASTAFTVSCVVLPSTLRRAKQHSAS
jgi:hypothetical protein